MTPRSIVWLDADDPPEEHRQLIAKSRHSYYPVARSDLDDLLGVASIKDALAQEIREGRPTDLLGSLRTPPLLPEGAPATEALAAFKRSGLPLALVVDERGDIEGLVTPTDVLEALVGLSRGVHSGPSCYRQSSMSTADADLRLVGLKDNSLLKKSLSARSAVQKRPETRPKHYKNAVLSPWFRG